MKSASPHITARVRKGRRGFTLAEMMVACSIMVMLSAGVMSFYVLMRKVWTRTAATMTASYKGAKAINRIIYRDGIYSGLRAATGTTVVLTYSSGNWQIDFNNGRWIYYNDSADTISDDQDGLLSSGVLSSTCTVSLTGADITYSVVEGTGNYIVTNRIQTYVSFRN